MSKNDTYNGWSNRATWNVNLWLANDQGLYNEVNRLERRHVDPHPAAEKLDEAREAVDSLIEEIGADDPTAHALAVEAREKLREIAPPAPDLDDFAEALEGFCRELWPNGETPDGDRLDAADFEEIAAAWVAD